MQQQQKQISTGGQSAQAAASSADAQTSTPAGATTSENNQLTLKNLAQGTTEESLMKALRDLSLNPSKVFFVNFDKEIYAQISFPDYQSLCNAAATIDQRASASSAGGDQQQPTFTRGNFKSKAQFSEKTSCFIRNLPQDVTDDMLFQEFQKHGSVINCQVLRDHMAVSKQKGLVNFINAEQAQNAIQSMNDKPFPGSETQQKILVTSYMDITTMTQGKQSGYLQKTNLYVSGLPNDITEAEVRTMFEEFGKIRSILLKCPMGVNDMTKHITSLLPIYSTAYVNFENEQAALAAFAINQRGPMSQIKVAYYVPRQGANQVQFTPNDADVRDMTHYRVLFLTKLNKRLSQEELKEVCSKYGTVQTCKLSMGFNQTGQQISLGKATVAYSTSDEASTAMQKLYFESALGDYIQIDFFQSREARIAHDAQNSDFSKMLTQYSQRYQNNSNNHHNNNNQSGYGRGGQGGGGGYQGRGGYSGGNNHRGYNNKQGAGGNPGAAGGAGRYQQSHNNNNNQQHQQQQNNNNQYQPRQNRNNNQGGGGQQQQWYPQQQHQNQQMMGRKGQQPEGGSGQQPYGQQRPSRGGGARQHNQQYRNSNQNQNQQQQSQQYPNQRRQYQQQNRQQNNNSAGQQRIAIDSSGFPALGGQPQPQQQQQPLPPNQQQPMPIPQMPVPVQQQQPAQAIITPEVVAGAGPPEAQKQFLGEHLYPRVSAYDANLAGRIVGMILDAYSTEQICENLANEATLRLTVERATETLREHEQNSQQQ